MNSTKTQLHVVLGAGQIGSLLKERLLALGHRVRIVRRGEGAADPRVEQLSGDMRDHALAERACAGATVVYDCMNPSYEKWPEMLLPMAAGALHGAQRAGARLVALDCLYMYGRASMPMQESSPMNPCSKKGELRVSLSELRLSAHRRGDVALTIGRASDFFGPALPFSGWSDRFFQRVYAGKKGECMGDPDMPHSYTYVNDIARALCTLGAEPAALGQVWHLPTPPAESTRSLAERLGRALSLNIEMTRVPKLLLRAVGLFQPFMREVVEMTYQWEIPFVLEDSRFCTTFGYGATPVEQAVNETAAWARTKLARA